MNTLLKDILRILARLTLARFTPKVVAITGSVGKTSTKEAIATVLGTKFSVRASLGNYNNEIGVPLTIINEESGNHNAFVWLVIFIKAIFKILFGKYPEILVLEMGTDRPGDIEYLVDLVGNIDVAVLTSIGISHLEFFSHPEALAREKLSLIKKLPKTSAAVLNFDSPKVFDGKNHTKAEIVGFGFDDRADILVSDFQIIHSEGSLGANFKIHHKGNVVPFFLPNALGKPTVYAAAAAVGVGLHFQMNLVQISEALKQFSPPPGRLRLIEGIKHTKIIDDTYNAAPESTNAALDALKNIAPARKLAAIGDMAELGQSSETGHRDVAAKIVENQIDQVFLVGSKGKIISDELGKRMFTGKVLWFNESDDARLPIQNSLIEGDTILVKGSQSMRMEKIVKEIMADPQHGEKLLVRQSPKWLSE
jgi:UDP-N-acetylmuramoyl-tripeptide--D-alanyl-D-alanine ligase